MVMNMRTRILLPTVILAVLALVSCGDQTVDTGAAPGAEVDGEWALVEATVDDAPVLAVDGYPITLNIVGGRIGGNAGCNTYGGTFTRDGTDIVLQDVSITEMACVDPGPMDAESRYMDGFWRATSMERTGDRLTLTGDGVVLSYDPVAPVLPAPVIGSVWTLDTIIDGPAASSIIDGLDPAILVLADDGSFSASTGCREFGGDYVLEGDRLELAGDIDAFACDPPANEQDTAVLNVLGQPVSVEVVERRLTLSAGDGAGLSYRADQATE